MSTFLDLESLPGAVFTHCSSVPLSLWNNFFRPAPSYQSDDVSPKQLLLPLAQFGAVLAISVWWGQLWLFTLAALGFVWIDTQMAFKINKKFKAGQKRYNTLVAESVLNAQRLRPTFIDRAEEIEKSFPISKPLKIFSHKDFMAMHFGSGGITTSAVCVFPAQVMQNRLSAAEQSQLEAEIGSSLQTQLQQQQRQSPQNTHALYTVDDASSSFYSQSCQSIESIFRPKYSPFPSDEPLDDGVSHLTSLEDLDLDLIRSGSSSSSSTASSSYTETRRDHAFPTIDNILSSSPTPSLHSISLDAIHPVSHLFTTEDDFSSDETRDSDGIFSPPRSRPESPTTSVSNYSDDEADDELRDLPPSRRMHSAPHIAQRPPRNVTGTTRPISPQRSTQKPSLDIIGITRPISPQHPPLKRATSQKPRKNNGWKKLPKKARLSTSAKKKFLSRAFW